MSPKYIPLLVLATSSLSLAKRSMDLVAPASGKTERVIAVYAQQPEAKHLDKVRGKRGKVHRQYANVPVAAFEVTPDALAELDRDPDVIAIAPDRAVTGATLNEAQGAVRHWDVVNWYGSQNKCQGCSGPNYQQVGIAVIDSGIYPHKDFNWWGTASSRIAYAESFIDGSTTDLYGHGTHVAGILGADGNISCLDGGLTADGNCKASEVYFGGASGARLISLKVLDANGVGTDSVVIAAIDRAIQLKTTHNIRVMNLSLGRPVRESYKTDPLCLAVERAWKAGIVVVVAAGNMGRANQYSTTGYGAIMSPANDPLVITVGAINTLQDWYDGNDRITTYSSKGPTAIDQIVKPDIVAPGNNIAAQQAPSSRLAQLYPANRVPVSRYWPWTTGTPDKYLFLNGTSMAAPIVAGAAAVMIDRDPTITPDIVKARLMKTARRGITKTVTVWEASTAKNYTLTHDIFTVGAGVLDEWAAFNNTERPSGSAASPKAVYNSSTKKVSLNFAATGGTNLTWGTSGSFSTNIVWGDNIIWGTSGTSGFNIIWGTTSPWGTAANQAEALAIHANGDK